MIDKPQEKVSGKLDKKISFSHHDIELYTFLSKADTDMSKIDYAGWTPMHRAIEINDIEMIKLLIYKSNKANLGFTNRQGRTPLTYAISKGNLDVIEFLVKNGADTNFEDQLGWTPMTRAIDSENVDIIRFLCENGADLDLLDSNGWTPIEKTIVRDNLEILQLLIEKGANINVIKIGLH